MSDWPCRAAPASTSSTSRSPVSIPPPVTSSSAVSCATHAHLTRRIADVEPIIDSVIFLKDGGLLLAGDADDLRQDRGMSLDTLFRKEYR